MFEGTDKEVKCKTAKHNSANYGSLDKSFFFFAVLGLELRADTLNHSTSPFL
jgi:hypothetical protein